MILEVAVLDVKPGQESAFEAAFAEAQVIIASMPGYIHINCSVAWKTQVATFCW
jgi:heme-degrading monooxygenase HmoA